MLISKNTNCRACKSNKLKMWISLGKQPLANAFLASKNEKEEKYPLDVYMCTNCGLIQLIDIVSPDVLFKDYVYYSSTSEVFRKHFEDYAKEIFNIFVKKGELVVDIGSNDGILLKPFKELGARVLGVEPATEIANYVAQQGIETLSEYFTPDLARFIVKEYGNAKVITANNVFAHINDVDSVLEAVKILLAEDGVFVIEVPYLWKMIFNNTFDLIYHEHLSYFDSNSLETLLNRNNLYISQMEGQDVHGGSVRVFITRNKTEKFSRINIERTRQAKTLLILFSKKIKQKKEDTLKKLEELKKQKKTIVGYGAPAKGNTLLNYYGIDSKILDYIVDDSPAKQGLFTPGTHIEVKHPNEILKTKPDYILILAWNFADSIKENLVKAGYKGKFLLP